MKRNVCRVCDRRMVWHWSISAGSDGTLAMNRSCQCPDGHVGIGSPIQASDLSEVTPRARRRLAEQLQAALEFVNEMTG